MPLGDVEFKENSTEFEREDKFDKIGLFYFLLL
jgi:hypothetical protein